MLNPAIITAYSESASYADRDSYISDIALSSMWGEDADRSDTVRIAGVLWDIHAGGISAIKEHSKMSGRKIALTYGIPTRTMEDWGRGVRTPPDYVLLLLAHAVGII